MGRNNNGAPFTGELAPAKAVTEGVSRHHNPLRLPLVGTSPARREVEIYLKNRKQIGNNSLSGGFALA